MRGRSVEPLWDPPLSERYFAAIQSFQIEIIYPHPITSAFEQPPGTAEKEAERQKILRLSYFCDQLHRLVARLRLRQRPIAHLQIAIRFSHAYSKLTRSPTPTELFATVQILLSPFRRLRQVSKAQLLSVIVKDSETRDSNLLLASTAGETFAQYLKSWSEDLSSSHASSQYVRLLEAYWRMVNLASRINDCCYAVSKICRCSQFRHLLQAARIAREAGNLDDLRDACDQVAALWLEHLRNQKVHQYNIGQDIEAVDRIIRGESRFQNLINEDVRIPPFVL